MDPSMGLGGGCPAADTPAGKGRTEIRLTSALALARMLSLATAPIRRRTASL